MILYIYVSLNIFFNFPYSLQIYFAGVYFTLPTYFSLPDSGGTNLLFSISTFVAGDEYLSMLELILNSLEFFRIQSRAGPHSSVFRSGWVYFGGDEFRNMLELT